jgi:hypothetical protein
MSPLQGGAELIQESVSDLGVAVVSDCAAAATPTDRTPYWFITGCRPAGAPLPDM